MEAIINYGLLFFIFICCCYVAYCFGHVEGFRKGSEIQRRINKDEL